MRVFSIALIGAALAAATAARAQDIDWQKVDEAFGRKAAVVSGDVHRYGFPRTDLTVTLDGVTIKPALALGGWVAFKPMGGEAMVMGDLVLLETEIKPVMTKMIENGLDITAVHNHLLRANPATFYMHVGGHGDPVKLATAIQSGARGKQDAADPARAGRCAAGNRSRHCATRPDHRRQRPGQWRRLSIWRAASRPGHRGRNDAFPGWPDWASRPRSVSSRPAAAMRRSPAISS